LELTVFTNFSCFRTSLVFNSYTGI